MLLENKRYRCDLCRDLAEVLTEILDEETLEHFWFCDLCMAEQFPDPDCQIDLTKSKK